MHVFGEDISVCNGDVFAALSLSSGISRTDEGQSQHPRILIAILTRKIISKVSLNQRPKNSESRTKLENFLQQINCVRCTRLRFAPVWSIVLIFGKDARNTCWTPSIAGLDLQRRAVHTNTEATHSLEPLKLRRNIASLTVY